MRRIKAVKWVEHIGIQHDSTVNLSVCLVQTAVKVIERKQQNSLHLNAGLYMSSLCLERHRK